MITGLTSYQVFVSTKTTWVFICLHNGAEIFGWGEATCFGAEQELDALCAGLSASLSSKPASSGADLAERLRQASMSQARLALMSAIEQGWLDGLGRMSATSISAVLGGDYRKSVPFYANINRGIADRSPDGFATQARAILHETGATALKIAPFDGLSCKRQDPAKAADLIAKGLDRIAAVRHAVGSATRIMVDCHARFTSFEARRLMPLLASSDVFWVEEPCEMADLSAQEQRALRAEANAHGLRMAGGENIVRLNEMSRLLKDEGHDVVLPDLRLTGIANGMAMLRLAADLGVEASIHNPVGPVLDAVSAQVASALPSFLILERQIGESPLFDQVRGPQVSVSDGAVLPANEDGIGFSPVIDVLKANSANPDGTLLTFSGLKGAGADA